MAAQIIAAAIGAAIYLIGRYIIQYAGRVVVRFILPILRRALKWLKDQAIEIGREALHEAVESVLDFMTGSEKELQEYIKVKSSLLPKQGSPNPTTGRQPQYQYLYRRPIPYRPIIARILCFANSNPVPGTRLSKKAKAEKKRKGEETNLSSTTTDFPKLRQIAATILFELLDLMLDWKSPLKSDMMYKDKKPLLDTPDFRPKRRDFSYKRKFDGTFSPDIAIVEDRHKAPTLTPDNLFAVVEIKFPEDDFNEEQGRGYAKEFPGVDLALIRVPEDCDCDGKKGKGKKGGKNKTNTSPNDSFE